jgi:hypothetical protein
LRFKESKAKRAKISEKKISFGIRWMHEPHKKVSEQKPVLLDAQMWK